MNVKEHDVTLPLLILLFVFAIAIFGTILSSTKLSTSSRASNVNLTTTTTSRALSLPGYGEPCMRGTRTEQLYYNDTNTSERTNADSCKPPFVCVNDFAILDTYNQLRWGKGICGHAKAAIFTDQTVKIGAYDNNRFLTSNVRDVYYSLFPSHFPTYNWDGSFFTDVRGVSENANITTVTITGPAGTPIVANDLGGAPAEIARLNRVHTDEFVKVVRTSETSHTNIETPISVSTGPTKFYMEDNLYRSPHDSIPFWVRCSDSSSYFQKSTLQLTRISFDCTYSQAGNYNIMVRQAASPQTEQSIANAADLILNVTIPVTVR